MRLNFICMVKFEEHFEKEYIAFVKVNHKQFSELTIKI